MRGIAPPFAKPGRVHDAWWPDVVADGPIDVLVNNAGR
jgi:hypothetical protein